MRYSVSQINSALLSKVGGKAITQIPNIYSLFYEAGITEQSYVDLPSSIRNVPFINPLYTNSSLVLLPQDFTSDSLISIGQQDGTAGNYYPNYIGSSQYALELLSGRSTVVAQNGYNYLQTGLLLPTPIVIDSGEFLGSWAAVGTTTNVRLDTSFPAQGVGDIAFDIGVGSSNGIQNTSLLSTDISSTSTVFFWLDMPLIAPTVTGVRLTIGSSTSNYYQQTVTGSYSSYPFAQGYNLLEMDLTKATATGTPNLAAITYAKVEILGTITTATAGFRLDAITAMPTGSSFITASYYSSYIWVDAQGNRIQMPSQLTDSLVMNPDEYVLFLRQLNEILNTDMRPAGASTNLQVYGGNRLMDMYKEFNNRHPSLRIPQRNDFGSGNFGFFNGRVDVYETN